YIWAIRQTFREPVYTGVQGRPWFRPWRHLCIAQVVKRYAQRRMHERGESRGRFGESGDQGGRDDGENQRYAHGVFLRLDIMTSDGSADLRFNTQVSLPAARAASCSVPC